MALGQEVASHKQDPSRATVPRKQGSAKSGPSKLQLALLGVAACVVVFIFHHQSLTREETRLAAGGVEVAADSSASEGYLKIHAGHRDKVQRKKARWRDLNEEKKEVKEQKKLLWEEKRAMRQENELLKQEEHLLAQAAQQRRKGKTAPEVARILVSTQQKLEDVKKRATGLHEKEKQQEQKFEKLEHNLLGDESIAPGRKLLDGHEKVLQAHHENEKKAANLDQKKAQNDKHEAELKQQIHKEAK
mmetsp:Transcript_60113/g.135266  ORF Transcript_60113/g.135266 Transcript_60113/m.135266 type:complete len:246 (-) Transcript_60113:66-803(-)